MLTRPCHRFLLLTSRFIANGSADVDDAATAFDDLALAKKKKKSKKKDAEKDKEGEAETPAADGELDLAALKKKKKKSKPKADDTDDFDAKLAQAVGDKETADEPADDPPPEDAGDMDDGTGIWSHDSTQPIHYELLLTRFFKLLNAHNPDLFASGSKSYKIPPPQCLREGNKKTIFANIAVSHQLISTVSMVLTRISAGDLPSHEAVRRTRGSVPVRRIGYNRLGRRQSPPCDSWKVSSETDRKRASPIHRFVFLSPH